MAEEKSERMFLPLFNGSNYSVWKFRMEILLEEHELSECIWTLASEVEDLKEATGDSQEIKKRKVAKREKRAKLDRKCKSLLVSRIHDSQLEYILDKKYPKDIWDALRWIFERRSIATRMQLQRRMLSLRFEGGSLQQHFLQFDKHVREYRAAGVHLEELDVVCYLLLTLGSSYSAVVTVLESMPEENLLLEIFKCQLLNEETKQKGVQLCTLKSDEKAIPGRKQSHWKKKMKEDGYKLSDCPLQKEDKKKSGGDLKLKAHLAGGSGVSIAGVSRSDKIPKESEPRYKLNNNTASLTCLSGQDFLVDGTPINSTELQCSGRMTGEVEDSGDKCGTSGSLLKLGFEVEGLGFLTYIESCYDRPEASVVYTKHVIPGAAIEHSIKEAYRPGFKVAGTSSHVSPATSYTQKAQMDRFVELLGSEEQAKQFLQGGSYYLARGHLAPDADGIYRSWQWATFFYVNVAPQWQVVNAGNWLVVENMSRSKATQLREDVIVYDGVHDILLLPHVDGQSIPITLEGGGIRVPKWYWKIIISPTTSAGIAFVTNNDPFRKAMSVSETLCEDVCQEYGWNDERFGNFDRGFTYCCTVDSLRDAIKDIPRDFHVNSVLRK